MSVNKETIAAICTGLTGSGINIIRISGDEAFAIAEKIFRSVSGKKVEEFGSFSVHYGYIVDNVDKQEKTLDEVLLLKMQAPHSYTKEDVIEIDCHGGILVTRRILELVLKNGARLAEPGEFTKRAYLNGRIDLSQAEAVIGIINAKSNLALKNSVRQLKGQVKDKIMELRDRLISKTAYIEAALDDPEHISLDGFSETLADEIKEISFDIKKLIGSFDEGRLLNEGINTCILGLPNAGKSSLLNALLSEDRAIVTDIAGTTRDVLRETVSFGDVVLNIMDTAGIRDTEDVIERIGVDKARKAAEDADLILYVVDLKSGLTKDDEKILEEINDKKLIIVYNKSDLVTDLNQAIPIIADKAENVEDKASNICYGNQGITVSSLTGAGIEELKNEIKKMFYSGSINADEEVIITNERHRELLVSAGESLNNVMSGIDAGMSEDFLTIDMMDAYESLGKIVGESVEDDLADRIFRDFCMGK